MFLSLLPYNSNFPYFEIKSLVHSTSNLGDSTYATCECPEFYVNKDMFCSMFYKINES